MPTRDEAAEHGIILLRRDTPRQKWRDEHGRIWKGEVRNHAHHQLRCWLSLKPDFDYHRRGFWTKSVWFGEQTASVSIPGLISLEEAEKVEPFTTEALDKLAAMHQHSVIEAMRKHNEFMKFVRSLGR